jgi:hypothetical protein
MSLSEIPLTTLKIYGIMGPNMIPLAMYNLRPDEVRKEVIQEILSSFANDDVVILGGTMVRTEAFDGFKII